MRKKRCRLFACGLWCASLCFGLLFASPGVAGKLHPAGAPITGRAAAGGECLPACVQGSDAAAVGQGARLRMERAFHDFGEVPRKGGNLVCDFPFVNDGTVPLVITRVVTSCSCIKASFPRRPVAPGAKGCVRITYEPLKSEPGTFHKVIQVFSNAEGGLQVITVQGCSVDEERNQ